MWIHILHKKRAKIGKYSTNAKKKRIFTHFYEAFKAENTQNEGFSKNHKNHFF